MNIWINKQKNEKIHTSGKHWVNDGIVYQLVRAEREVRASIFDCTYLVSSTVLGTSLNMHLKCNIFISKQKHSFSQVHDDTRRRNTG